MQLLRLAPSATVAGTNVDMAEVSEMYMSDLPSPQPLDIEYVHWMRKCQSETDKPAQFVFVKISLRLKNDRFIDCSFSLSTGL